MLSYIGQSLFIFVELILNKYFFKNKSENNIPEENEHTNIVPIKYIFIIYQIDLQKEIYSILFVLVYYYYLLI